MEWKKVLEGLTQAALAGDAATRLILEQCNEIERLETENKTLREALAAAQHELATIHGLHAHDGHPESEFMIDTSATAAQIDNALSRT